MPGQDRLREHRRARKLVASLIVSSGLTIASFLTSTVVSDHQARGIEAEADAISERAVPASVILSNTRADLRHVDEALDLVVYHGAPKVELAEARATFLGDWAEYVSLPAPVPEHELWQKVDSAIAEMDVAIARVMALVEDGSIDDAAVELTMRTRPALRSVFQILQEAMTTNLEAAARSAAEIARLRESSHALRTVLNAASALSAVIAAFLVVRMTSRYTRLADERIEEMDRFAGRVAHDIRSPLNAVGLALELARHQPDVAPRTRSILDRGTMTLARVGQLIDGLLVFARAGKPPSGAEGADVDDVLRGVAEDLRRTAEEKEIAFDVEHPSRPLTVACTSGVLASLVSNLVGNALKYMGEAPVKRVSVRVFDANGVARIEVHDTGPGVAPELRSKIFEPFARASETTVPGVGLGLATVRRLAEAHGGRVGVESKVGAGSVFWFELPKKTPAGAHDLLLVPLA